MIGWNVDQQLNELASRLIDKDIVTLLGIALVVLAVALVVILYFGSRILRQLLQANLEAAGAQITAMQKIADQADANRRAIEASSLVDRQQTRTIELQTTAIQGAARNAQSAAQASQAVREELLAAPQKIRNALQPLMDEMAHTQTELKIVQALFATPGGKTKTLQEQLGALTEQWERVKTDVVTALDNVARAMEVSGGDKTNVAVDAAADDLPDHAGAGGDRNGAGGTAAGAEPTGADSGDPRRAGDPA